MTSTRELMEMAVAPIVQAAQAQSPFVPTPIA